METAKETPFLQSLLIQVRVVGALLTRALLTSHGRRDVGFLWLIMSPMIFTLLIGSMNMVRGTSASTNVHAMTILVTGFSYINLLRSTPGVCSGGINANRRLLQHRHIRIMDLFFANLLLEICVVTISLLVFTVVCSSIGLMVVPVDVLEGIIAWALLAWFASAWGLVMGSLMLRFPLLQKFSLIFTLGAMTLSGALTPLNVLPEHLQTLLLWIPTVHGMEMLREAFLGTSIHAKYDIEYMSSCSLCMTFIGIALARASHTDVENR